LSQLCFNERVMNIRRQKILTEKTLGEKLRTLRRRQHLTLEQAEEETKVRARFLDALERGAYGELPADVYVMGFLAKYGEFLGVAKEELIQDFRRERGTNNLPKNLVPDVQIREKRAILTPKIIVLMVIALIIIAFLGYIFYAVENFTSPPNLEIQSPSTETVIRQESVEIIGKTDEGASLKINDQVVFLDQNGNFRETVKLQPGLNNIELRATNRVKKETVKVIKILAEF